ncbi:hypothetical protein DFH06DRAFT_1172024 [Mycena polygramma]|nr:hypothetical protein DFH06DRAFT_1172024 [Mycena polygramma]
MGYRMQRPRQAPPMHRQNAPPRPCPAFTRIEEFAPGMIVWCDPMNPKMDTTTFHYHNAPDPKPKDRVIWVAPITTSEPSDRRPWMNLNSGFPCIGYEYQDVHYIWVGKPARVDMVFGKQSIMHHDYWDPSQGKWNKPPVPENNLAAWHHHHLQFLADPKRNVPEVDPTEPSGSNGGPSSAGGGHSNQFQGGGYPQPPMMGGGNGGFYQQPQMPMAGGSGGYYNAPPQPPMMGGSGGGYQAYIQGGTTYFAQPTNPAASGSGGGYTQSHSSGHNSRRYDE